MSSGLEASSPRRPDAAPPRPRGTGRRRSVRAASRRGRARARRAASVSTAPSSLSAASSAPASRLAPAAASSRAARRAGSGDSVAAALQEGGGGAEPAASLRAGGRALELHGDPLVRGRRRLGEMPRAAVRVEPADRSPPPARGAPPGAPAPSPTGRPPSARADDGRSPARRSPATPLSRRRPRPRTRCRAARPRATRAAGRRAAPLPPPAAAAGPPRERLEPLQEALLDPPGHRVRAPSSPSPPGSCVAASARGSSRIASGLPRVSATSRSRTRSSRRPGMTVASRARASSSGRPAERQLRQAGQLALVGRVAHARTRSPPTRPAAVARRSRAPGPRRHRATGRHRRSTAAAARAATSASRLSAARATRKRSGAAPDARPSATPRAACCGSWKSVEPVEHRRAELMQPRERQLHLGLDAGEPRDAEARRLPGAMVQQRRLADARLAADDQHRALAAAHVLQQPVERLALAGSAQQDRGTARGHGGQQALNDQGCAPGDPRARRRPRRSSLQRGRTPRLDDAVAIVTGGSCGAGRDIARTLASRGYAVVVVYLRDQARSRGRGRARSSPPAARRSPCAPTSPTSSTSSGCSTRRPPRSGASTSSCTPRCAARPSSTSRRRAGSVMGARSSTSPAREAITPVLADELRARDITVNGVAPGWSRPGARHDVADLLALLEWWPR